jgi:lauroyl/myristoyl acyltransferase
MCIWKFEQISNEFLEQSSLQETTQKIADIFSEEILNNPEQYLWVYDRFKT